MRRRTWTVLFAGVGAVVLLCRLVPAYGGNAAPGWLDKDRFKEIPWGSTLEQAQTAYRELSFVRFAIDNEKEPPSKVYGRKDEVRNLDGIRVDEILYWFRENAFYKVTVTLYSKIGPRTLGTPASAAYGELLATICRVVGDPVGGRGHGGGWDGERMGVWRYGRTTITLRLLEHPGDNSDEMDLEFVNAPAAPGHGGAGRAGEQ